MTNDDLRKKKPTKNKKREFLYLAKIFQRKFLSNGLPTPAIILYCTCKQCTELRKTMRNKEEVVSKSPCSSRLSFCQHGVLRSSKNSSYGSKFLVECLSKVRTFSTTMWCYSLLFGLLTIFIFLLLFLVLTKIEVVPFLLTNCKKPYQTVDPFYIHFIITQNLLMI